MAPAGNRATADLCHEREVACHTLVAAVLA